MVALKGDLSSIARLKRKLREMPTSLAHDVAQRAAPAMTAETREAHEARRSVYGEPRANNVSLVRTGATARELRFAVTGTVIRAVLGTRYAKYLIGRYGILPNGPLPAGWSRRLAEIVASTKAGLQ